MHFSMAFFLTKILVNLVQDYLGLSRMKIALLLLTITIQVFAQSKILIPMDTRQTDHLKAYGITFNSLKNGGTADWLLNYKGGSFLLDYSERLILQCQIKGVLFEVVSASVAAQIYAEVQSEENNSDVVRLEKAPTIAVYVPPGYQPWDDAVMLALNYAEVPYDKIWIKEMLGGKLEKYDWLHLHHEDFTGQYGKFYAAFSGAQWYIEQQYLYEKEAKELGYKKVSDMEKAVVLEIKNYVSQGGFLFAMCSATDSYDIALAALDIDIVDKMYDGDPPDANAEENLNFDRTFAFQKFQLEMNPLVYEYSNIDIQPLEIADQSNDYFTLFDFSAKYDPVPTMLVQNHVNVVRGFMGQTTMFRKNLIKNSVQILAERPNTDQVKYIHGNYGRGLFMVGTIRKTISMPLEIPPQS